MDNDKMMEIVHFIMVDRVKYPPDVIITPPKMFHYFLTI